MADKDVKKKLIDIVDQAMTYAYEQARVRKSLPVKEAATSHYVTQIETLFAKKGS